MDSTIGRSFCVEKIFAQGKKLCIESHRQINALDFWLMRLEEEILGKLGQRDLDKRHGDETMEEGTK